MTRIIVTLYSLRYSFYTHVESEMPPRLLKLIFGHSDSIPRGVYGDHMINEDIVRARLNLEAVLTQTTKKVMQNLCTKKAPVLRGLYS